MGDRTSDACLCDACSQDITILIDGIQAPQIFDVYLDYHIARYKEINPRVRITVEKFDGSFFDLQKRLIDEVKAFGDTSSWDAVIVPSQITGMARDSSILSTTTCKI